MGKKVIISNMQVAKSAAGAARNTHEQIRYFLSRGFEVHVAADRLDAQSIRRSGGIPHKIPSWPWNGSFKRKFYDWGVRLLIKRLSPNLVVGHGDLQHQDVLCLHNSVHLAHELIYGSALPTNAEMYPIHTPILARHQFKHMIANSELMKKDAIKRFALSEKDITVVYPAYDEKKFTSVSLEQRQQIRLGMGVQEAERVIGLITSGNFKKRGVDIFFKSLELLDKRDCEKLRVWIVGKDKALEIPAALSHLKIEFKPVIEDVENYFRALDLFVLPARIEEFGRVALEAMACGCPTLLAPQVGAAEIIRQHYPQMILKSLVPNELATALLTGLSQDYSKVGAALAKLASDHAEDKLAPKFDQVFENWL